MEDERSTPSDGPEWEERPRYSMGEQLVQKLIQVGQVDLGRLPDLARKRR